MSCGDDTKKSVRNQQSTNPICSDLNCLTSVNWKIFVPGRSFPIHSRIDINGETILNECISKQKYAIDRATDPEVVALENFFVPKIGELKIDIVDMGEDCKSETYFIKNDNVDFDLTKTTDSTEIIINL